MRNGLNIGSASEMVHEVCTNEAEARVRFHATASPSPRKGAVGVEINSIHAGTIRIARDFNFELSLPGRDSAGPSPLECLLMSLGGCVLITWVQGCAVKGMNLHQLAVRVSARTGTRPSRDGAEVAPLTNVAYQVSVESDGSHEQIVAVARNVTCFSPMHRTFVEGNAARLRAGTTRLLPPPVGPLRRSRDLRRSVRPQASEAQYPSEIEARLEWRYGAHMEGSIVPTGQAQEWRLGLDLPKQLNGLDRAPNAQEYMMAALAGELCATAGVLAPDLPVAEVGIGGSLDLRGCLNTGQTDIVRVHDILYDALLEQPSADGAAVERCSRGVRGVPERWSRPRPSTYLSYIATSPFCRSIPTPAAFSATCRR